MEHQPATVVSTQEKADTLILVHALEIVKNYSRKEAEFLTRDTDWWVIMLCKLPELGANTGIVHPPKGSR